MKLFQKLSPNLEEKDLWQLLMKLEKKIKTRRICANTTLLTGTALFYLYAMFLVYSAVATFFLFSFPPEEWQMVPFYSITLQKIFAFSPLPWYGTLILLFVGLFAFPWLIAAVVEGITLLLCQFLVKEKNKALPEDNRERKEALARKAKELYHKQYDSTGLNLSLWPNYIASALFGIIPFIYLLCQPFFKSLIASLLQEFSSDIPTVLGWVIAIVILAIVFAIPCFIFSFILLTLELLFDKIFMPLYRGRHWYPRCKALKEIESTLYQRWIAVDPEEKQKDDDRKKREQEAWETKQREKEEFMKTMARVYVREKKEKEDYLKRLHEWANDDDGIDWRGKGDGI